MDARKLRILDQILSHLSDSQAGSLKSLLDDENKPVVEESEDEASVMSDEPAIEDKVDGAIAEVSGDKALGDKEELLPGEEEMTDDELSELLKKHLS
jgi:hypothetical protein